MSEQKADQEIVKRVLDGDKQAYNILVVKYQYRIMKLIGRYVRDQQEVLDVAQETFIKAYRALDKFRGDSAFYTWLYRIAINTAKNYVMSSARRPTDTEFEVSEFEHVVGSFAAKEDGTPEHLLLSEEIQDTVSKVIDKLPKDLRTAILLRELDGLSYEDIAYVMDCPVGTVRSRIFRARTAIEEKIKPLLQK